MDEAQIKTEVISLVSEALGKPVSEITVESRFVEDLGADSLDNVELVIDFEKKFNIEIPDEKSTEIVSVGDAIKHIKEHFDAKT